MYHVIFKFVNTHSMIKSLHHPCCLSILPNTKNLKKKKKNCKQNYPKSRFSKMLIPLNIFKIASY